MEYSLKLPYPKVCGVIGEQELLLLYDLYAGRFSELTNVTTYVYQSVITKNCNLTQFFQGIAISEMNHLNLLANAIFTFNADPVFAGKHSYFSGSYTNYERDLGEIILSDLQNEKEGIASYKNLANITLNGSLSELLNRIVLDEELHVEALQELFERVKNC